MKLKPSNYPPPLRIKEATMQGYAEAYEGDSVNLDVPDSKTRRGRVGKQVSNTLLTGCNIGVVCLTPKRTDFGKAIRRQYGDSNLPMSRHAMTNLEPRGDEVTNTLTTVQKDNLLMTYDIMEQQAEEIKHAEVTEVTYRIRKLTPRECFRLMGVDDKDIDKIQAHTYQQGSATKTISRSQQYKMAGNSIVVDVLYHIFRKMFVETESESRQLEFF